MTMDGLWKIVQCITHMKIYQHQLLILYLMTGESDIKQVPLKDINGFVDDMERMYGNGK